MESYALVGTSVDAGVLGGEGIVCCDLLLGAVEFDVWAGEVLGLLGIFLGLVELGLQLHD